MKIRFKNERYAIKVLGFTYTDLSRDEAAAIAKDHVDNPDTVEILLVTAMVSDGPAIELTAKKFVIGVPW